MLLVLLILLLLLLLSSFEKGRQRLAGIERFTPYQSEDHSPTIPTHKQREANEKQLTRERKRAASADKQVLALLSWKTRQSYAIEYIVSKIVRQR